MGYYGHLVSMMKKGCFMNLKHETLPAVNNSNLDRFKQLSPDQIEKLLIDDNKLSNEIIEAMTLDSFIAFTLEVPEEKLHSFVSPICTKIQTKILSDDVSYTKLINSHSMEEKLQTLDFYFGKDREIKDLDIQSAQYNILKTCRDIRFKFFDSLFKHKTDQSFNEACATVRNIQNKYLKKYALKIYLSDSEVIHCGLVDYFFRLGYRPLTTNNQSKSVLLIVQNNWPASDFNNILNSLINTNKLSRDDWNRLLKEYLYSDKPVCNKQVLDIIAAGASPLVKNPNGETVVELSQKQVELSRTVSQSKYKENFLLHTMLVPFIKKHEVPDVDYTKSLEQYLSFVPKNELDMVIVWNHVQAGAVFSLSKPIKDKTLFQLVNEFQSDNKFYTYFKCVRYLLDTKKINNNDLIEEYKKNFTSEYNYFFESIIEYFKLGVHPLTQVKNEKSVFYYLAIGYWTLDPFSKLIDSAKKHGKMTNDELGCALNEYLQAPTTSYRSAIVKEFYKAGASFLPSKRSSIQSIFNRLPIFADKPDHLFLDLIDYLISSEKITLADLVDAFNDYTIDGKGEEQITVRVLEHYFRTGVDPLTKDSTNRTLFYRAAKNKWSTDKYNDLLMKVSRTEVLNKSGFNIAFNEYCEAVSAETLNYKICKFFLYKGASLLAINDSGKRNAITLTLELSRYMDEMGNKALDYDVVKDFLDKGANISAVNKNEEPILCLASRSNWTVGQYLPLLKSSIVNKIYKFQLENSYVNYVKSSGPTANVVIEEFFKAGVDPLKSVEKYFSLFYLASVNAWPEASYIQLIEYARSSPAAIKVDFDKAYRDYVIGCHRSKNSVNPKIQAKFVQAKASLQAPKIIPEADSNKIGFHV